MNADPNTLLKALFLDQLPADVRKILATSTKTEIGENKERRHKAYDTMSIADSTLGL